ncbi:MAG: hypothetical protein ABJB33_04045 [Gemmatimonadota bacterium]
MIVLPEQGLTPTERHGLDVLVDLSRLLPAPPGMGAVRLEIVEGGPVGVAALSAEPVAADGRLLLPRRVLAAIGEIVSAAAEQLTPERDRLGRVPTSANLLIGAGAADTPVVSRLAMHMRQAIARVAGDRPYRALAPWPHGKRWAAALTHDLDVVALWPAFTALRLAELGRKGEWRQVGRILGTAARSLFADPVRDAVLQILAVEAELGIRSTWFILCGTPTVATFRMGDLTYRPESAATRRILEAVGSGGHEIGLHGSLETAAHPDRFIVQHERLGVLAPNVGRGVRQHFLRMAPGLSQRGMISGGFAYDATWGFSDRNAFRLGVADVVPWFETEGDTVTPLDVVPFCWMDRTQSKYLGVEDPMEWARVALERAERCREVEGLWCGIWHPNLAAPLGYPGAPEAFGFLGRGLAGDATAWLAPLGEVVQWRRRRRSAGAVAIGPTGEVVAHAAHPGAPLWLEDAAGAPREQVEG